MIIADKNDQRDIQLVDDTTGSNQPLAGHFQEASFSTVLNSEATSSTVYTMAATDPDFVSDDIVALNGYSRSFFACWLVGLLVTTVAHFVHFSG